MRVYPSDLYYQFQIQHFLCALNIIIFIYPFLINGKSLEFEYLIFLDFIGSIIFGLFCFVLLQDIPAPACLPNNASNSVNKKIVKRIKIFF